ncbi:putative wall-associated receptor kinase, galacturonan-binding domain-containing protein [Rosa chinensis]|uniref:Putative wall-associated receptor kinase, galacturonan-binding domain-containing protein n=1 Tax=Rosa chinensis TaxID=74649 RepID=A0A2P6PE78_ROSCH|nr:putative wall-associated receptor kinase, galacturonan-binding domain-containing protein [Rosa chinensis]
MFSLFFLLWNTSTEASSNQAPPMAKPNCQQLCGVSIPYPFGIGPNKDCYIDKWFEIECRNYSGRHKPFLSQ